MASVLFKILNIVKVWEDDSCHKVKPHLVEVLTGIHTTVAVGHKLVMGNLEANKWTDSSTSQKLRSNVRVHLAYSCRQPLRVTRFWLKVGQIFPKWDKSGTFSDQISGHASQNVRPTEI